MSKAPRSPYSPELADDAPLEVDARFCDREIEVTNPDGYRGSTEQGGATIAAHGGRYLARGGTIEVIDRRRLGPSTARDSRSGTLRDGRRSPFSCC